MKPLGYQLRRKGFGAWITLATIIASLICGLVGLFTHTVLWDAAILVGLSAGLAYMITDSRESSQTMAEITRAIGRLTPIPDPDDVFRHARYTLRGRSGKGGWKIVRLYAPVGVWLDSDLKDAWLDDLTIALKQNEVKECWAVYGLPPQSEIDAFHQHADPRLRRFKDAPHSRLHYIPPADAAHPNGARGLGIIIFEGYGTTPDYTTIFLFMADNPDARSGFMIEDQAVGQTVASWFDSEILRGCSSDYLLRPEVRRAGMEPSDYMEDELSRIATKYYPRDQEPGG